MTTPIYDTQFLNAYLEAALWSSVDDDGDPLDQNYSDDDIDSKVLDALQEEAARFYAENERDIETGYAPKTGARYSNEEMAGHDFWLTRNGHGAGFWDGDWMEPQASRLTEASKRYGGVDLYVGDDGKIYAMGYEKGKAPRRENGRMYFSGTPEPGAAELADEGKVDALDLFTENEPDLYEEWKHVARKLAAQAIGRRYDRGEALRMFRVLVDRGARRFAPEYQEQLEIPRRRWTAEFPLEVRQAVAERYVKDFEVKFKLGELAFLLPPDLRAAYDRARSRR